MRQTRHLQKKPPTKKTWTSIPNNSVIRLNIHSSGYPRYSTVDPRTNETSCNVYPVEADARPPYCTLQLNSQRNFPNHVTCSNCAIRNWRPIISQMCCAVLWLARSSSCGAAWQRRNLREVTTRSEGVVNIQCQPCCERNDGDWENEHWS